MEKPRLILKAEYELYKAALKNDIYFKERKTRSRLNLFTDRMLDEKNYTRINKLKTNKKLYKRRTDKSERLYRYNKNKISELYCKKEVQQWLNSN
ncbi:hypothetical protein SCORR_v1c05930 [Spiroplasma corruscae]|uniref:Uncharacterized protein n=1 Tax=Spiroplasma corruscae TaxID=216934 RepID=A0A222EPC0_9MOLU|nr:hypothetical protein [Spiroplasma corruscae]ASP28365.1 hypothetical protein SCORR_v1c05930 [Spiroplasma corruscae]